MQDSLKLQIIISVFYNLDMITNSDDEVLVTKYLDLDGIDLSTDENVFLQFQTNAMQSVAFEIDVTFVSKKINRGVAYGMTVLIVM